MRSPLLLIVLVLAGCAATDASGRRCTREAPCEPLSRWMDAERDARSAVTACHGRQSEDCTGVETRAAAVHRDWLERYKALLERVGGLPTYAMAEQVGPPQIATASGTMEIWIWRWWLAPPPTFGEVRMAFDHFNGANSLRAAMYCDPDGCKSFFTR